MPIRTTKENQSIADYLIRLMPGLNITVHEKARVNPMAAKSLFAIWNNTDNKINDNMYKKPTTIGRMQVEEIERAGLARQVGENLEITEKGADVIKVMVLSDNASVFEEDSMPTLDYATALSNTKNASRNTGKQLSKKASNNWWGRYGA